MSNKLAAAIALSGLCLASHAALANNCEKFYIEITNNGSGDHCVLKKSFALQGVLKTEVPSTLKIAETTKLEMSGSNNKLVLSYTCGQGKEFTITSQVERKSGYNTGYTTGTMTDSTDVYEQHDTTNPNGCTKNQTTTPRIKWNIYY